MSNPIGLYRGDPKVILEKIASYTTDCEANEDYEFPFANALGEKNNTDSHLMDLGAAIEARQSSLSPDSYRFLSSFTWDWLGGTPVNDLGIDMDAYGVNAVISNETLRSMGLTSIAVEGLLGEEWSSYLTIWHDAYTTALESGEGIVLKVWA